MASSQSSSYGGIPLTTNKWSLAGGGWTPNQAGSLESYNAAAAGGLQPNGMGPTMATEATPAAGMLSGAEGAAAALFNQKQPGVTGYINGASQNASSMQGIASGLNGATYGNLGYANQALIDAFDPQKTAYNYYLNQALNTAGAQEAQGGYANTPYGAEVTGATGANFTNNWRTAQIGRESTGAATATGLQNQFLGEQQAAANIFDQAGNLDLGSAQALLGQYGLQGQNMAAALQAMTQLFGDMKVDTSQSSSTG